MLVALLEEEVPIGNTEGEPSCMYEVEGSEKGFLAVLVLGDISDYCSYGGPTFFLLEIGAMKRAVWRDWTIELGQVRGVEVNTKDVAGWMSHCK